MRDNSERTLRKPKKCGKVRVSNRYVPEEEKWVAALQGLLKHKLHRP